jgi:Ca2+-transporting ATPase
VLLELVMDLSASVAFVSEPTAPSTMLRPPRDPAGRFLDRSEVAAILTTVAAVLAAVLASYLAVRAGWGPAAGRSAALASWLTGHVLVASSIRARPALPLRANPAFPAWALAAAATGVVLVATPAGHVVGFTSLPPAAWPIIAAAVAGGTALAAAGRRAAGLGPRL